MAKAKKTAKPRKLPDPRFANLPKPRELSKIVKFYCEHVRSHSDTQLLGVIRHIQLLLHRGEVTAADVARAVRHYSECSTPKQFRFSIRRFMREDMVKEWLNPHKDPVVRKLEELRENATVQAPVSDAHDARFVSFEAETADTDPEEWF